MPTIANNLAAIQARITAAALRASRAPETIRLVAVTKSVGVAEVKALYDLGVRHFGENRPEDVTGKLASIGPDACWHAIGNLQRRKAKIAVSQFQRIDGVDRIELAAELNRRCEELGLRRQVLIEVNVSGEAAKHGISTEEVGETLRAFRAFPALDTLGLMTMAPFGAPDPLLRSVFSQLRRLAETHQLPVLSMGMTDDFETAIEEGATEVRIGRALFV